MLSTFTQELSVKRLKLDKLPVSNYEVSVGYYSGNKWGSPPPHYQASTTVKYADSSYICKT